MRSLVVHAWRRIALGRWRAHGTLSRFPPRAGAPNRPSVTLAFAQSMDGCLAERRGAPTGLSGPASTRMTHELRARHDAILVGIGTVLADDPLLTTRLVRGPSPRPVILDTQLRIGLSARVLVDPGRQGSPIIVHAESPGSPAEMRHKVVQLEALGATVLQVGRDASGPGLCLAATLEELFRMGIQSLMVEGGAAVLRAFLASGTVDEVAVTIAPVLIAPFRFGDDCSAPAGERPPPTQLHVSSYERFGNDMVCIGQPSRTRHCPSEEFSPGPEAAGAARER